MKPPSQPNVFDPIYTIDPDRMDLPEVGICIRALGPDSWGAFDVAHLTAESLLDWLRSRDRDWAINVVGVMLGYGNLVNK